MSTKPAADPRQIAAIVGAVLMLGGSGGAGYFLRGSSAEAAPPVPVDRIAALEQWRAAREAIADRDRAERSELSATLKELNSTNSALRDAVLLMTERYGALDGRVRVLEQRLGR